jgi:hypothetical protein
MSLTPTCGLGLCTHLAVGLYLRLALSHTLTQPNTSAPLPEPERHGFTPKKQLLGCLIGSKPVFPSASEAGLNSHMGSYQSDEQCSPPLAVSCTSPGSIVCPGPRPNSLRGRVPSPDQAIYWHLAGSLLLTVQGTHPSNKGGEKKYHLRNPG